MLFIEFLIIFPLVIGLILLAVKNDAVRKPVVCFGAAVTAVASIALAVAYLPAGGMVFEFQSAAVDWICFAIDLGLVAVVLGFGIRYRRAIPIVLGLVQLAAACWLEFGVAHGIGVECGFYLDELSILMALIIGIIGSGICVYALGYMADFQRHEPDGAKDRRPYFFFLLFAFLSAMYLIVFSNNMAWMLTGWEITTVCSFLLIGYTKTEEAIDNSFRQIAMNLLGGIAFACALIAIGLSFGTLSLDEFLELGVLEPAVAALPVCALAFASLTKAAQMPFHTWLLGAMVAPTPTSALLHSSTMVKAGVFLLVKLAPLFAVCALPAYMVMFVGGFTFLFCSAMAISQSNAKRVLAYSTIANLGLIALCAGLGTAEAVWAALFLILFHAIAKSLLFLCVGTAEHHIGSRNIEDMDLLFERMPRLARFMLAGIMVMFIAPFGMLLSKWAALVSLIESGNVALILILGFGSAVTFMFWAKWMGKLSGIAGQPENVEATVHGSERIAQTLMVVLAVLCCCLLPVLSQLFAEPYLAGVFGFPAYVLSDDNLAICAVSSVVVFAVLFAGLGKRGNARTVDVYLSGVSVDDATRTFRNSLSGQTRATARNMYLEEYFGEARLATIGSWLCVALMAAALLVSALGFMQIF